MIILNVMIANFSVALLFYYYYAIIIIKKQPCYKLSRLVLIHFHKWFHRNLSRFFSCKFDVLVEIKFLKIDDLLLACLSFTTTKRRQNKSLNTHIKIQKKKENSLYYVITSSCDKQFEKTKSITFSLHERHTFFLSVHLSKTIYGTFFCFYFFTHPFVSM